METSVKQTKMRFNCVGILSEKDLKRAEDETEIGRKGERHKVKCESVKGKVSVDTGHGIVTFFPEFYSVDWEGKDSQQWDMALAMLDWNPKIKGDTSKEPTRVRISGEVFVYDKYDENIKNTVVRIGYRVKSANTRISDEVESGLSIKTSGFIQSITEEEVDEEPTGRVKVDMLVINYKNECEPFSFIVEEEGADLILHGDDEYEAFEAGQTRTGIEVGYFCTYDNPPKTATKRTFSHRSQGPGVSSGGKRIEEYILFDVDPRAVEEPEELTREDENGNVIEVETDWINPSTIKKMLKERRTKLDQMKANPPEKKKSAKSTSIKDQKAKFNSSKANSVPDFDVDEEDPF